MVNRKPITKMTKKHFYYSSIMEEFNKMSINKFSLLGELDSSGNQELNNQELNNQESKNFYDHANPVPDMVSVQDDIMKCVIEYVPERITISNNYPYYILDLNTRLYYENIKSFKMSNYIPAGISNALNKLSSGDFVLCVGYDDFDDMQIGFSGGVVFRESCVNALRRECCEELGLTFNYNACNLLDKGIYPVRCKTKPHYRKNNTRSYYICGINVNSIYENKKRVKFIAGRKYGTVFGLIYGSYNKLLEITKIIKTTEKRIDKIMIINVVVLKTIIQHLDIKKFKEQLYCHIQDK